ncbi:hypothetical protein WAF17_11955 [Bernardetia sp. ABR2-2B]|uniref:hypothetical protein n=1 Tax=Bernardetia sp. ABR2-2B TaxID=3127472 RepID=UPI0030D0BCD4
MLKYLFIFVICLLSSFSVFQEKENQKSFYFEEFEPLDYRYALEDSILLMYKDKINGDKDLEARAKEASRTFFHKMEDNQKEEKQKILKLIDKKGYKLVQEKGENTYVIQSKLNVLARESKKATEILYDISKNTKEIEKDMNLKEFSKFLKKL